MKGRVCILTDNSVQYTHSHFSGQEFIHTLSINFQPPLNGAPGQSSSSASIRQFQETYLRLGREFDVILTITLTPALNPAAALAQLAADQHPGSTKIAVIDSQTTAVGLGLLVQAASRALADGTQPDEVEQQVRQMAGRIYTLFCIPDLKCLIPSGHLTPAQAEVGEMLGLLPILAVEDGRLAPLQKVRTQRHLIESFQEYLDEFNHPDHIALIKNSDNSLLRTRLLREYVAGIFPETVFSEHAIPRRLAELLGPQCISLIILEKSGMRRKL